MIPNFLWDSLPGIPEEVNEGGCLTWDGGDIIYAFVGGERNSFYAYSISANAWCSLPSIPAGPNNTFVSGGGDNKEFWVYYPYCGTWRRLPDVIGPGNIGDGGALTLRFWLDVPPNTYKCQVYALKGNNSKEFCRWVQTIRLVGPPSYPNVDYISSPPAGYATIDNTPTFNWVYLPALYHLRIYKPPASTPIIDTTLTTNNFTPEEGLPDGEYLAQLRWQIGGKWSDWTEPHPFQVNTSLPTPPQNAFLKEAKPTFRWQPQNQNSNLFEIQVSENPIFDSRIIDEFCQIPEYTPNEEIPDGEYFWRVREKDTSSSMSGWSDWTTPIRFLIQFNEEFLQDPHWESLDTILYPVNEGGALTFATGNHPGEYWVYAFVGGDTNLFYRYWINAQPPYWQPMAPCPYGPDSEQVGWGASLAWAKYGNRNDIYAFLGNETYCVFRYSISEDQWFYSTYIPPGEGEVPVEAGGSLIFIKIRDTGYLYALKGNGSNEFWRGESLPFSNTTTGGGQSSIITSAKTQLLKIKPNPFSKGTMIYLLPQKEKRSLRVYNLAGKLIKTFSNISTPFYWDGKDNQGREIPSGIYFFISEDNPKAMEKVIKR